MPLTVFLLERHTKYCLLTSQTHKSKSKLARRHDPAAPALSNMTHVQQDVELDWTSYPDREVTVPYEQETVEEIEQVSLPPMDRGKEAWLVLAGCSLIQIPVWGTQLPPNHRTTQLTIS